MATAATLVGAGKNNLRYLMTYTDASALTITNTGAASPDLTTDTATRGGTLRKMALQFTTGYGKLAAGALTQAQARAIWNNDDAANAVGAGIARAQITTQRRTGVTNDIAVDVNVDGAGKATIVVTPGVAAAGSCYVDVAVPGTIGA